VLVVDDDAVNRMVAKGMLVKFGIEVDTVGSGQEALDSKSVFAYDLAFMGCHITCR